jgi:hypothetical protein
VSLARTHVLRSSGRSFPELPPLEASAHARLVLRPSSLDPDAEPFDASPGGSDRLHFSDSEVSLGDSEPPVSERGKAVVPPRRQRRPRRPATLSRGLPSSSLLGSRPLLCSRCACPSSLTQMASGRCRAAGVGAAPPPPPPRPAGRSLGTSWENASTASPPTTFARTARSRPGASWACLLGLLSPRGYCCIFPIEI